MDDLGQKDLDGVEQNSCCDSTGLTSGITHCQLAVKKRENSPGQRDKTSHQRDEQFSQCSF
jgi:hypothetical protein